MSIGVIIYGCRELFFLLDMTVPKDANMQVTVMARSLQLAYARCNSRCRNMPRHFRFHFDNTPAEGKNQTRLAWFATLVGQKTFDSIDAESFEVGHTHNEGDQRFAVVGSTLSRQGTLEDPLAFKQLIEQHVKPMAPN